MTFISYAQNFEDVLLNRVFKDKTKGFYIDVGALHPSFDSVTKAFYDRGWSGINIEPIEDYYNIFKQERPRDINLNIALSNSEGNLDFFQVVGQAGNSTLNKEIAYKIAKEKSLEVYEYTVSVKTLAEICQEYANQKIDFLKIDVEGLEEQVILGGNWDLFRPTVLVIETTLPSTNIRCINNIPEFLTYKCYKHVFFDGINDYYIAEESSELVKYFSFPVNVLDFYVDYRFIEQQRQINQLNKVISLNNNAPPAVQVNNIHPEKIELAKPIILVDGVFFQINQTGIARVWKSLLEEWKNNGFAKHIIVLDRAGTAPKISGIKYLTIEYYDYNNTDADRKMLQQVCEQEEADLFISSYYTNPITTPSIFIAYDMTPEVMGWDLNTPMWRAKHQSIQHASAYIAISENTACDLASHFTDIPVETITVAHCGVNNTFSPVKHEEINNFKTKYGIRQPYFLLVGTRGNNKNIILFFKAFSGLSTNYGFDIILTGSGGVLPPELRSYTSGSTVHILQINDQELATAYSGAVALVYPSKYEGFGMPIVEAMACACPVITCPNSSIPEIAGEAVIYVNDNDVYGLANALCEIQKPNVRQSLIDAGLAQAKKFSWSKMAKIVSAAIIDASILYLNLKEVNIIIFPDWSQSEELISLDLERVIKALADSLNTQNITLLIHASDINSEDAAILVSGVTMNLLMQEDLDVNQGLEISLVGNLADIQWAALLSRVTARIVLECDNEQVVANCNRIIGITKEFKIEDFIQNAKFKNNLSSWIEKHQNENTSLSELNKLRLLRREIAELFLGKEKNQIEKLYETKYIELHKLILNTGIKYEPLTDNEQSFVSEILSKIAQGVDESSAIQYLLAAKLYCHPYQLPSVYDLNKIPSWLLSEYLEFNLKSPPYFQEIGEVDNYSQYMERWVSYLHTNIINYPQSKFWHDIAEFFTKKANFIPLYFTRENLKDIYIQRADIMESCLQNINASIEYNFPERPSARTKIKVGILANHFSPQTETFAALSVYEHLNRDIFEVILFTFSLSNHRLERYCIGHADAVIKLPGDLVSQVRTIREVDLDILFIATNITAVTHQITLLSLHRLARIQMVDANSPVTTGMRHIDYYISSKLSEPENHAQQDYTETLITLDTPPQCFDFATERQILPTSIISKESLGIKPNTVIYISGANFYKIIPEQEVAWAKIIASVPNSKLLLYPFNPNWSSSYPAIAFQKRILKTFAQLGISQDRLILLDCAPNRADVKERLKLADIYLDSYPYSGMTSLIDPLEVGLPIVVMEAESSRSRKGASLLRELQIPDLITNTEETYIQLAVTLGTNIEFRQQKAEHIKQKMLQNPMFLDSYSHSAMMGEVFQNVFYKHQAIALKEQLILKDINLIIFPDWMQSEDELGLELQKVIQVLATYPESEKITLIINAGNIATEDAEMFLASVAMNLLMEDLDITDTIDISLLDKLGDIQWKSLLPLIYGRIILTNEDESALAQAPVSKLHSYQINSLITQL